MSGFYGSDWVMSMECEVTSDPTPEYAKVLRDGRFVAIHEHCHATTRAEAMQRLFPQTARDFYMHALFGVPTVRMPVAVFLLEGDGADFGHAYAAKHGEDVTWDWLRYASSNTGGLDLQATWRMLQEKASA